MGSNRSDLRVTHDWLERATRSFPRPPVSEDGGFPSSLAVIWEFANVEQRVATVVGEMLNVLSELTPRLEVALVDNGSTDETIEVAQDLAQQYPQIIPVRLSAPSPRGTLLQSGLVRTAGEVVLYRSSNCVLDVHATHEMWREIETTHLVLAGARGGALTRIADGFSRAVGRRRAVPIGQSGMEMVRRCVIDEIGWLNGDRHVTSAELRQRNYRWTALDVSATPQGHPFHGTGTSTAAVDRMPRHDLRRESFSTDTTPTSSMPAEAGIPGPTSANKSRAIGAIRDFTMGE